MNKYRRRSCYTASIRAVPESHCLECKEINLLVTDDLCIIFACSARQRVKYLEARSMITRICN